MFAEQYIVTMEQSWRNPKHRAQWRSTFRAYAAPLTLLLADQVATADVLSILKPIWSQRKSRKPLEAAGIEFLNHGQPGVRLQRAGDH